MGSAQRSLEHGDDMDPIERYDALRHLLSKAVNDCADHNDIQPGTLALLIVDLGVAAHMFAYILRTEKPSALGLRLDLDRFRKEIEDFMRSSKKSADDYVTQCKQLLSGLLTEESAGTPDAA